MLHTLSYLRDAIIASPTSSIVKILISDAINAYSVFIPLVFHDLTKLVSAKVGQSA